MTNSEHHKKDVNGRTIIADIRDLYVRGSAQAEQKPRAIAELESAIGRATAQQRQPDTTEDINRFYNDSAALRSARRTDFPEDPLLAAYH